MIHGCEKSQCHYSNESDLGTVVLFDFHRIIRPCKTRVIRLLLQFDLEYRMIERIKIYNIPSNFIVRASSLSHPVVEITNFATKDEPDFPKDNGTSLSPRQII